MADARVANLIIVSDPHCGCRMGLCPPEGFPLDDGGHYMPGGLQQWSWPLWLQMWDEWVPRVTRGEPYAVVLNGDGVEGVHHRATTPISHNLGDQEEMAYRVLAPIVERCDGRFYYVRGTEAHGGPSGVDEERLARRLGAIPDKAGKHARWELRKMVGMDDDESRRALVHCMHTIGTTSSQAYESSAVNRELVDSYVEAARWGRRPPDFVIRSHRHRCIIVDIPTSRVHAVAATTPGWQGKTPFVYRTGGKLSQPQFGALLVRQGDEEHYLRAFVHELPPDPPE